MKKHENLDLSPLLMPQKVMRNASSPLQLSVDEAHGSREAHISVVEVAETAERNYGQRQDNILEDDADWSVDVVMSHAAHTPVDVQQHGRAERRVQHDVWVGESGRYERYQSHGHIALIGPMLNFVLSLT